MPRRVTLPGADELFRTTGGAALQAPQPRQQHAGSEPQGDTRLRPGQDPGQGGGAAQGDPDTADDGQDRGGRDQGGGTEHGGRDVPQGRRPQGAAAANGSGTVNGSASAAPAQQHVPAQQPYAPATAAQHPVPPPVTAQPPQGQPGPQQGARRKAPRQNRRPSGRERHDEKITVYVSAEELMDLEHARLVLRGEHGLAIDRGRIVREAVAVVLADLESRGDASILVRRLRGR
ncbi:hypothetical protein [Streptomyces sp. NBC_01198]|uniref:hypothetical protein n=1 Tax=Streptomyces sp. NBC_01198 TaxID=2903769 RepID=UPI002E134F3C|nr:hypothetical protein OG702_28435 [Streptomyces sp. NBC_01198]